MKRVLIILAVVCVLFSCSNNKKNDIQLKESELKKLEIPENYVELIKSDGDLDNDGMEERVIVLDTDIKGDWGTEREVYICKKENDEWMLWKIIKGPVMSSKSGGIAGDPFVDLIIDKGKIFITHQGGSREKWYYNHSYKLIDAEFKLVNAVVDYGVDCIKWETYIYNLEKGTLKYDLAPDECEENLIEEYCVAIQEDYNIKKTDLPLMDGYEPGNNELALPEGNKKIYY